MGNLSLNATLQEFYNFSTGAYGREQLQQQIDAAKSNDPTVSERIVSAVNVEEGSGADLLPANPRKPGGLKANDRIRKDFFEAIARQFGGEDKIPARVIKEMKLEDYGGLKKAGNGRGVEVDDSIAFTSNKKLSTTRMKSVLDAVRIEVAQRQGRQAMENLCRSVSSGRNVMPDLKAFVNSIAFTEHQIDNGEWNWSQESERLGKAIAALHEACGFGSLLNDEPVGLPVVEPVRKAKFMRAIESIAEMVKSFAAESFAPGVVHDEGAEELCVLAMRSFVDEAKRQLKWSPVDRGEALKQQLDESVNAAKEVGKDTQAAAAKFLDDIFRNAFVGASFDDVRDAKACESLLKLIVDKMPKVVEALLDPARRDKAVQVLKNNFRRCAELMLPPETRGRAEDNFACFVERAFVDEKSSRYLSDRRMKLLNALAAVAFGKSEGSAGGKGYMGIVAGKPVKFLTHATERIGKMAGGLAREQIALCNAATANLRETILMLARQCRPETLKAVEGLLGPNAPAQPGRLTPPLQRTTVAEIISLIAQDVHTRSGEGFHWENVRRAPTLDDTSIGAIFPTNLLELEPAAWRESHTNANGRVDGYDKYIIRTLQNPAYQDIALEKVEDFEIETNLAALGDSHRQKVARGTLGEPYLKDGESNYAEFSGTVQEAVRQYEIDHPGQDDYAVLTFADATYAGGTIVHGGQEENLFGTSDFAPYAAMIKRGQLKVVTVNTSPLPETRLEYVRGFDRQNGKENNRNEPQVSSVSGVLLKAKLTVGAGSGIDVTRLLAAWPSFQTTPFASDDIGGNADWAIKCVQTLTPNRVVTPEMRLNAMRFFNQLVNLTTKDEKRSAGFGKASDFEQRKVNGEKKEAPTRAHDAMMMAMFLASSPDAPFDIFGDDPATAVGKLLELIKGNDYGTLLERATQNYVETGKAVLRSHFDALLAKGKHVLFGGPIGCGFFRNVPEDVATMFKDVLAEEPYRSNLRYVYCKTKEDKQNAEIFSNALKGQK